MKILVVDIETTGFFPDGKIVEVGMVELCLDTGERKIVFNEVINPGVPREELEKCWIVTRGSITPDEILNGKRFEDVKEDIQKIVDQYEDGATAFNRAFDFPFLEASEITFVKKLPCPMLKSTPICKLPGKRGGYKWPKVEEAHAHFFPDACYKEIHRGADDAMHEAEIVYALHKTNNFLEN